MIEPINVNGPSAPGIFEAATGVVAAANGLVELRDALTQTMGATLGQWSPPPSPSAPSIAVWYDANTVLICFGGDEDAKDVLDHIAGVAARVQIPGGWINGSWQFKGTTPFNWAWTLLTGIPGPFEERDFIIAGHSSGGAYAFAMAVFLLQQPNAPRKVDLFTMGEPRVFEKNLTALQPNCHFRTMYYADPIPCVPLRTTVPMMIQLPWTIVIGLALKEWQHYGTPLNWGGGNLVPAPDTNLTQDQFLNGGWQSMDHNLVDSYYQAVLQWYKAQGITPQDAALYQAALLVRWNQDIPAASYAQPVTADQLNTGDFPGEDPGPATDANLSTWEGLQVTPALSFFTGGSSMTQMRGEFLFTQDNQGWSETVHSSVTGETYASMTTKMQQVLPYRQMMMCTTLQPGGQPNPKAICSIQAIRVSDDNLRRDGLLTTMSDVATVGGLYVENWPPENVYLAKVVSDPTIWALWNFHAVPMFTNPVPLTARHSVSTGTFLNALNAYVAALTVRGLGFRQFVPTWPWTGTPPVPFNSKPTAVVPSPIPNRWRFTVPLPLPTPQCTVRFTKFKNLAFLNGRRPCIQINPTQFDVIGNFPTGFTWDGTGDVTPFTWNTYTINSVQLLDFGVRKVGAPFGDARGRARRRLVS